MVTRLEMTPTTLRRLESLLSELVASEETYIENLSRIVQYSKLFRKKDPEVPVPKDLQKYKGLFVFCNIDEIYQWHKQFFLISLIKYRQSSIEFAKAFTNSEAQFHMYCKYCNNISIAEFIVAEYKDYFAQVGKFLGHDEKLNDLLRVPIIRLAEYKLLLSQLAEHLRMLNADWEYMHEAYIMIEKILQHTICFNALESMKNYEDNIYDHGKLIFHQYLTCKYEGKTKRHYVILFKRLLMFTDKQEGRNGIPTYTFRLQIPMNKLILKDMPNKRFMLKSIDPNSQDICLVCNADTEDLQDLWLLQLKKQLKMQADLIAALQNPSSENEREV
ncbi:rho guanine nucleotide exchange factor 25-like [Haematobia irritans]|uniref:rho guanine nucleotide exchange factor 25-like n=1 Tax=Haematobia irritans TaxID=7368 RepID=UPI003F4F40E3